jgi:hypothetical protein
MKAVVVPVVAIAVVATACRESRTEVPERSQASQSTSCANQTDAKPHGDDLSGDIDGDGAADRVRLLVDRRGRAGCAAFVVADTETGELAAAIAEPELTFELGLPALAGLVDVDGRPGAEVLVTILAGASTQFAGLFTARGDELERVTVAPGVTGYGDLFPSGGSVGHLEATGCGREPGSVVVSTAIARNHGYRLTREVLLFRDARLERDTTERLSVSAQDLGSYPEFQSALFGNC